jgi:hypothetical protein
VEAFHPILRKRANRLFVRLALDNRLGIFLERSAPFPTKRANRPFRGWLSRNPARRQTLLVLLVEEGNKKTTCDDFCTLRIAHFDQDNFIKVPSETLAENLSRLFFARSYHNCFDILIFRFSGINRSFLGEICWHLLLSLSFHEKDQETSLLAFSNFPEPTNFVGC